MATLVNSFEGGTNGTTITAGNSGGNSGNAFDIINIGTSATVAFDATHAAHGLLSCHVATAGTATISSVEWAASLGSQSQTWFRSYMYLTAWPASNISVIRFQLTGASCALIFLSSAGIFTVTNPAFTPVITFTTAAPLNQWFRIEGFVTASATAGQAQMSLYSPMDSVTSAESHTTTANQVFAASLNQVVFGIGSNIANYGYWEDDIAVSTTGPLGPSVLQSPQLVTAASAPNTVMQAASGIITSPVCQVTSSGTFVNPGISGTPPNLKLLTGAPGKTAVMQVKPGVQVRVITLVDATGNFVS